MRKCAGLAVTVVMLACAGIALAGQAATNSNGDFIDLNVAVTPPVAGTAKAPQGVSVSFDSFAGNRISAVAESTSTSVVVRFNKGFKFNSALFPACKINPSPTGLSKCRKSTQIGTGTGEAELPGANGAPPTFIPAKLIGYNGKPFKTKAPTVIFQALLNGKPTAELDFTAAQQSRGPYGLTFTEIHFPSAGGPSFGTPKFSIHFPDRTVTRKLHGKRVKVHLFEAPTRCNGSWVFSQTNAFTTQPPLTATDSQPCIRR
jgi:hypothetical protein